MNMIMYKIKKTESIEIENLIEKHYQELTAPRDDYWEGGFLPNCTYYQISTNDNSGNEIGYFSVDDENSLTQFYILENDRVNAEDVFRFVIKELNITSAFVETNDTNYLILCIENMKDVEVFFYLYAQCENTVVCEKRENIKIRIATIDDLKDVVKFNMDSLDDGNEEWLNNYCGEWIGKNGIYLFTQENEVIGIGELRTGFRAKDFAYIGVVVARNYRRQGLAQYILCYLRNTANEMGLIAVCSTDNDNIGSDKAIRKSGFYPYHRIFKVSF